MPVSVAEPRRSSQRYGRRHRRRWAPGQMASNQIPARSSEVPEMWVTSLQPNGSYGDLDLRGNPPSSSVSPAGARRANVSCGPSADDPSSSVKMYLYPSVSVGITGTYHEPTGCRCSSSMLDPGQATFLASSGNRAGEERTGSPARRRPFDLRCTPGPGSHQVAQLPSTSGRSAGHLVGVVVGDVQAVTSRRTGRTLRAGRRCRGRSRSGGHGRRR